MFISTASSLETAYYAFESQANDTELGNFKPMEEDAAKATVNGIKNVASVNEACLENNRNGRHCPHPSMFIPPMPDTRDSLKISVSVAGAAGICNPFGRASAVASIAWITEV